jgi:hypothetical protein
MAEGGAPIDLVKEGLSVFWAPEGEPLGSSIDEARLRFEKGGRPAKGSRGRADPAGRSAIRQAAVFVVALHSDVPGEVRDVMGEAVKTVMGGLKPDVEVGVIAYGDAISVLWSPDGSSFYFRDVNDFQHCLGGLREEGALSAAPAGPEVPCGRLFQGIEAPQIGLSSLPATQGMFPRFLGIPEASGTLTEAESRGQGRVDRLDEPHVRERFAQGALEAAIRLLLLSSPGDAWREIVILSDGRDGYLRFPDLAWERAGKDCVARSPECRSRRRVGEAQIPGLDHEGASISCSRAVIACSLPRVREGLMGREEVVRDHLARLVTLARAAGIRISTIALPRTDPIGNRRLESLAIRTGGTHRAASSVADLARGVSTALSIEMASGLIVESSKGLAANRDHVLSVALGNGLKAAPYRFRTGPGTFGPWSLVKGMRAATIDRLGHDWGPPAFWAGGTLAILMLIGLILALGKLIGALFKKVAGSKKPKAPPAPKVPRLKRPGG